MTADGELQVSSADVVRLILQYLKENSLSRSLQALQEETRVTLDAVESKESFVDDINHGRWDVVLQSVSYISLPEKVLHNLYEHVIIELMDLREFETASQLLRDMAPMQSLKVDHPDRYMKLDAMIKRGSCDIRDAFNGMSKERKRQQLAQEVVHYVKTAPASRLLSLIRQALKYQEASGILPPGQSVIDLFRGQAVAVEAEKEEPPTQVVRRVKFGKKSHPEYCAFSPDGNFLATGSVDGFIEIWDHTSGKLRKDLSYQAEDSFMMHESAVISLAFSKDSELLASGDQDGKVKIWKISSGQCLRRIDHAHPQGICSIMFAKDSTQVLTSSFDTTARVHGLKSGKTIKEFRGHASYVNKAIYNIDNSKVITCSSDGQVKVFDAKTTECMATFHPPPPAYMNIEAQLPINSIAVTVKKDTGQDILYVCNRSNTIFQMNLSGQTIRTFATGKTEDCDLVAMCMSPRSEWIYAAGEDNILYCFSIETEKLEAMVPTNESGEIVSLTHHPYQNIMAAACTDGTMSLMEPDN